MLADHGTCAESIGAEILAHSVQDQDPRRVALCIFLGVERQDARKGEGVRYVG